jgi:Peptidase family M48
VYQETALTPDGDYQHLAPLAYQVELRDYLKSNERELWQWFASAEAQADFTQNLRLELLKSTYRLDSDSHPDLFQTVLDVKERLQLDIPVTLYQAQNGLGTNAALYYIPGEGHVVFSGPVLTLLSAEELKSVIGHELAHFHLWACENGEFLIADRLIQAVAALPRAAASHAQSARRYQLYTEIFADRGSLCATGQLHPVIAGLVKIQTGLAQVSAPAYLKQAEEVFAGGNIATEEHSHPEAFIRARALALWHEQPENAGAQIAAMIEGADGLDELDLIGQRRLAQGTRRLLEYLLQPKWFQTPAVLGHAKLFFDDIEPGARGPELLDGLKSSDRGTREYLCYLLLDFVTADPELDEMPLAAALELSRELDLSTDFEKLVTKELKMKARDLKRITDRARDMLATAEDTGE